MNVSRASRVALLTLVALGMLVLTVRAVALLDTGAQAWICALLGDKLPAALFTGIVLLAGLASLAVDWYLLAGSLRRGFHWLAARTRWLRVFALFAPALSIFLSLRHVAQIVSARATGVEPPLGAGHAQIEWFIAGAELVLIAFTVLVVVLVARALRGAG